VPQGPQDAHVVKFNGSGLFLLQIGAPGKIEGPDSKTTLNMPAGIDVDPAASEVYIADSGNRRVVVFDSENGAYKRHWGAYGNPPDMSDLAPYDPNGAPAKQFRMVSCVKVARDGLVYVCDRLGNRIQVFQKDGKFVKEAFLSKNTLGDGAVWDITFSRDPQQRFMYVADGHDKKVFLLARESLSILKTIGTGGRYPGQFFGVGSVAVDTKGNVFTGETYEGKRVQRFVYKGMANVPGQNR
jgi:sugar lactone lactonase YvrE